MIKLSEEQEEIIDYLHTNNGYQFNLHKASEECQELGLILNQYLLKSKGMIPEQAIIDEVGDVYIRMEILKKMFSNEMIQKRIDYKLGKFKEYVDHKLYSQI